MTPWMRQPKKTSKTTSSSRSPSQLVPLARSLLGSARLAKALRAKRARQPEPPQYSRSHDGRCRSGQTSQQS
ncbi:hypothetical protein AD428_02775 [Achromobacter sp. DMS1]|nr:hypothetical protein AD428_02775 [Achromobacter sp. DMS1]